MALTIRLGKVRQSAPLSRPHPARCGRGDVMDQEVGAGQQVIQFTALARVIQIQRYAALVGVEIQKQAAVFGILDILWKGAATPGYVALGRLHLDYVGAQHDHQLGAEGGRDALSAFHR